MITIKEKMRNFTKKQLAEIAVWIGSNIILYTFLGVTRYCSSLSPCSLINWGAVAFIVGVDLMALGLIKLYEDQVR